MEKRTTCRNYYKMLRNAMSEEEVANAGSKVCDRILASNWYQDTNIILGYFPLGNEVNILPVLEHALKTGKRVALPRTAEHTVMDFFEINNLTEDVSKGAFHIMEPNAACEKILFDKAVVLVPGVVFDKTGNRYGYGKGFYDRYFARFEELCHVGVAYDRQVSEEVLECIPTDVKMHYLVTEKEQINCKVREWNY